MQSMTIRASAVSEDERLSRRDAGSRWTGKPLSATPHHQRNGESNEVSVHHRDPAHHTAILQYMYVMNWIRGDGQRLYAIRCRYSTPPSTCMYCSHWENSELNSAAERNILSVQVEKIASPSSLVSSFTCRCVKTFH